MQIFIDGNIIRASRTTGPDHHFLGIEFCKIPNSPNFIDLLSSPAERLEQRKKFLRENVFDEKTISLSIPSGLHIKSVFFDTKDSPNEFAYRKLLQFILDNLSHLG